MKVTEAADARADALVARAQEIATREETDRIIARNTRFIADCHAVLTIRGMPAHTVQCGAKVYLEAVQVGGLEKESAIHGPAVFVQRAVARVEDGSGHELVRPQDVGQETPGRAVVLFDEPDEEMLVELIADRDHTD